jgi:hypothetical protein
MVVRTLTVLVVCGMTLTGQTADAPARRDGSCRPSYRQSTMKSVAPTSVEERWGSALSATW